MSQPPNEDESTKCESEAATWIQKIDHAFRDVEGMPWGERVNMWRSRSQCDLAKPRELKSLAGFPEATKEKIRGLASPSPKLLMRVYSVSGVKRSAGISCPVGFIANASEHKLRDHYECVTDMPEELAKTLIVQHIEWLDRVDDIFLSFTNSLLFVCSHATGRHENGQEDTFMCIGDPKELTDMDGNPAKLYPSVPLLEAVGSKVPHDSFILRATLEWLSDTSLLDPKRSFRHVRFEDFFRCGLHRLCPGLMVEGPRRRSKLYTQLLAWRMTNLECSPVPITITDCEDAYRCSNLVASRSHWIHFYFFALSLGLRNRDLVNCEIFNKWVIDHYSPMQIQACLDDNMHKVPDNLLEQKQFLRIIRQACIITTVIPPPKTISIERSGKRRSFIFVREGVYKNAQPHYFPNAWSKLLCTISDLTVETEVIAAKCLRLAQSKNKERAKQEILREINRLITMKRQREVYRKAIAQCPAPSDTPES